LGGGGGRGGAEMGAAVVDEGDVRVEESAVEESQGAVGAGV